MGEECEDGDDPDQTCVDRGYPEGDSGGANLDCDFDICKYDLSLCSACTSGFTGDKCLEGGSCGSSSACTDTQCGAGSTIGLIPHESA